MRKKGEEGAGGEAERFSALKDLRGLLMPRMREVEVAALVVHAGLLGRPPLGRQ